MDGKPQIQKDEPNSKSSPERRCNRCTAELPHLTLNDCTHDGKEVCRVCIEIIIEERKNKKSDW